MALPSTTNIDPSDRMVAAITNAIADEAERIKEAEIAAAVQRFEKELRASIGSKVISVAEWYEVSRVGSRLIIEVKHKEAGR